MRRWALAFAIAFAFAPAFAAAQDGTTIVQGGEPGVHVLVNGVDVETAGSPGSAVRVDLDQPLPVTFSIHAPDNETWHVRSVGVRLVLSERTGQAISQETAWESDLLPGYTVTVNRTVDLAPMKRVGSGLFRFRVDVVATDGAVLYEREFFGRAEGGAGLLTAQGAAMTAATVASGYGLWSIVRDLREAYKARERHKKKQAEKGRLAKALDATVGVAAGGLEGAVDVAGDMNAKAERMQRRRPIAWTLTGLGLGGVALSWLQYFGLVPLDVTNVVIVALGGATVMLTLALLATALLKRGRTRTVPVEGPPQTQPEPESPRQSPPQR